MDILWVHTGELSVRDVHALLTRDRELAYTTVMTVLDRLAKKGLVERSLASRAWLYRPVRSKAQQTAAEVIELLGRLSPAEQHEVLEVLPRHLSAQFTDP